MMMANDGYRKDDGGILLSSHAWLVCWLVASRESGACKAHTKLLLTTASS